MHLSKLNLTPRKLGVALTSALLLWLPLNEQPSLARTEASDEVRRGIPGRRIGGGSRIPTEACLAEPSALVALMPPGNLGLTAKAAPTIWFSIPAVNPSRQLEFGLFNQDDELIFQTTLNTTGEAGVIGVDLAEMAAAPTLKANESYRWYLSIVCDPDNRSGDIWVDGWVQRVDLPETLTARLEAAAPLEQVQLSLENELWYESVTQLAHLLQAQSKNVMVAARWQELLQSIGLEQVAALPLLPSSAVFRELAVSTVQPPGELNRIDHN